MVSQESILPLSKYHKNPQNSFLFYHMSSFYTISYLHLEEHNENRYYIKHNITLHFYNFTILQFISFSIISFSIQSFYNILNFLQTYKTKSPSFSTRPKKIHNTQSFVIHSQSIPDSPIHIQNIIHPFKPGLWNTSSNLSRGNYNPLVHDALRDRRSFMNIYEHGMNIDDHRGIRNRSVGISSLAESPPFEKKERKREINKYERKDPKI